LHAELDHLLHQRMLIPVPQVSQRHQTESLTDILHSEALIIV
jgi:hypothetical protein